MTSVDQRYDNYYGIETEHGRVGLATCLRCGSIVILGDKETNTTKIHEDWHDLLASLPAVRNGIEV